jgi:hypothetical protein
MLTEEEESLIKRLELAIEIGEIETREKIALALSRHRCKSAMMSAARYLDSGRPGEALRVLIKEMRRQGWVA